MAMTPMPITSAMMSCDAVSQVACRGGASLTGSRPASLFEPSI
jgi:hypothetical protein